jgi:hypothetical protein
VGEGTAESDKGILILSGTIFFDDFAIIALIAFFSHNNTVWNCGLSVLGYLYQNGLNLGG